MATECSACRGMRSAALAIPRFEEEFKPLTEDFMPVSTCPLFFLRLLASVRSLHSVQDALQVVIDVGADFTFPYHCRRLLAPQLRCDTDRSR